jgi:hypothetical protein
MPREQKERKKKYFLALLGRAPYARSTFRKKNPSYLLHAFLPGGFSDRSASPANPQIQVRRPPRVSWEAFHFPAL